MNYERMWKRMKKECFSIPSVLWAMKELERLEKERYELPQNQSKIAMPAVVLPRNYAEIPDKFKTENISEADFQAWLYKQKIARLG